MLPVIVVIVAGGAFLAANQNSAKSSGEMTAPRALVFETALNEIKEPVKLRQLAAAFRAQNLMIQADLLEKRAKLRELPEATKQARREAFRKGMKSTDAAAINALAEGFEKEGATGAANELRRYASTLIR